MRKKLETKRGALFNDSSSEKLAIESRSLTDFKIPEIPIKRIKEIYKNSDLLKSRSESELRSLTSESNRQKEFENVYGNKVLDQDNTSNRKSLRSPVSDIVTYRSEISNSDRRATTQSIQSIFEDVKTTSSREAECISERIESQSVSERIEALNYTTTAKSPSDKSDDGISNISLKSESDQGADEIENSHSKETRDDNEISTAVSETKASRAFSNDESDSVSENVQKAGSVEVESETIETVPESKLAGSSDVSVQESVSKFDTSEVTIEHNSSSAHAISDTSKDKGISRSDTQVSPKSIDLEIQSDASVSKQVQKTVSDNASATEPISAIEELDVENSVQKSSSISNNLSFLELGNKNLNDDISTLENDLKALSEMMSQFSKKSDGRLRSEIGLQNEDQSSNVAGTDSEKGTSEDITDLEYPNDIVDQENVSNSNHNANATYIVEEEPNDSGSNEKDLTAQVTEIMLKIIPENATPPPELNREIDYKARSREILNEIEKSIISEHARSPESAAHNNAKSVGTKNEKVVDDLDSLENDIMSIAEIISHASEAKKGIKMIDRLGQDGLFDDREPIQVSLNLYGQTSKGPEMLLPSDETESFEVPTWNMPIDSNEEDPLQATDELKESLESLKKNLEDINIQNVARNLAEAPSTPTSEQTEIMFETIKDPEYEDISEESMEVSEIMDRSESQRSDRQFYQKPNRLPEKYQMTQKSEDVLRILDELSQKTNDGSARSQQLLLTPGNHGRKIDELLQRSERLSQNFETLTKKPAQLDVAPTAVYQKPKTSPVLQEETLSQQPQKSLDVFGPPRPTSADNLSQTADQQKPADTTEFVESLTKASEQSDTSNGGLDDKLYKSDRQLQGGENESKVSVESPTSNEIVEEDLEDKVSLESVNQSEKSVKSTENSQDIIEADVTGISSDKINVITEISEYQQVLRDNSIGSEASNDEIVSGSDKELDKSNGYSYNVEAQIHEVRTPSPLPSFAKNSLQKFEEETPESGRVVAESESLENTPEVISRETIETYDKPEESEVNHQHIVDKIEPFENVLQKIQDTDGVSQKIEDTEKSSDCVSQNSDESDESLEKSEDVVQKYKVDLPSESSEDVETPRSVSEIEIDSPRDPNDSRLDIDGLDDDLLANDNNFSTRSVEARPEEFHAAPVVATSEKDIEAMIDKLKGNFSSYYCIFNLWKMPRKIHVYWLRHF